MRRLPQIERKQAMLDLLGENGVELPVLYSEHLTGDGQQMFEHAAKLNWEGIISKRADAPYRSERNENWLKIKVVQKGKFPVIGFVKDPTGVAALYLGKKEGKDLVYMGKVGTGWSRTVSSQSGSNSIPSSAQSPSSQGPSGSLRPHGLNQPSSPTSNTATSPQKVCCGRVRLRGCLGNRNAGVSQSYLNKY
jgi:hypothetical protein